MKRAIASALTLFCVACGGSSENVNPEPGGAEAPRAQAGSPAGGENGPPEIVSAALEPADAGTNDALSVKLVVRDPDQDRVRTTVEWYRNGNLVEDLSDLTAPAGEFTRGDRVYAIVYATDGTHDVTAQTAALSIANAAPSVKMLRIKPERATALALLEVESEVVDDDGDRVTLAYRWLVNGEVVPGATTPRLEPGVAHRGDTVAVQVNVSDSQDETGWIQSKSFGLANSAPKITTQPNYELSGSGQYSYEVAAKDPDGDSPLRYEVVQGPPGMTVEVTSGVVTWRVPADAKGVYPIELAVTDPYGGKTTQSYSLAVDWSEGPKDAKAPARKPAPAAATTRTNRQACSSTPAAVRLRPRRRTPTTLVTGITQTRIRRGRPRKRSSDAPRGMRADDA
jgi:hypothetical protein